MARCAFLLLTGVLALAGTGCASTKPVDFVGLPEDCQITDNTVFWTTTQPAAEADQKKKTGK